MEGKQGGEGIEREMDKRRGRGGGGGERVSGGETGRRDERKGNG